MNAAIKTTFVALSTSLLIFPDKREVIVITLGITSYKSLNHSTEASSAIPQN
ncbi:hypothetical protein AM1_3518 [Acaryochloris marina MBIC11017]|uniref:Uncharacterized protein n=1 Tax=Acaryochloris marina (strain MBIC 11017) TaxID=329726 RepID=B0C1B0_ACAM1|nr:hypothetical protein AM1_3518 [Acaryochloris marina MBIC11017]